MKRVFFFIVFSLIYGKDVLAQETIARFKYEDAEKAFVAKNYQECIDNLDEAEKLLGKTAPNILHLKILAQYQLFEKNPFESYEALETLRSNCSTYLANYDISGLEEKYRDVYDISNQLPSVLSPKEFKELGLQHTKELREASLNRAIAQNNLVFVAGGTFTMGKNSDSHENGTRPWPIASGWKNNTGALGAFPQRPNGNIVHGEAINPKDTNTVGAMTSGRSPKKRRIFIDL